MLANRVHSAHVPGAVVPGSRARLGGRVYRRTSWQASRVVRVVLVLVLVLVVVVSHGHRCHHYYYPPFIVHRGSGQVKLVESLQHIGKDVSAGAGGESWTPMPPLLLLLPS